MSLPRAWLPLLLLFAVALTAGCDQATKGWAAHELRDRPPTAVIAGRVELTYAENPGVAFNAERAVPTSRALRTAAIVVVGLGLLGMLGVKLWRHRHELSPRTAGYALVLGGAVGNLIDRAARGHVIDFIHVRGWPIFNVADVAIAIGVGLVVLGEWRSAPATQT